MDTTKNIGLKKPAQEDFYSVEDFNENADIIDREMTGLKTGFENMLSETTIRVAKETGFLTEEGDVGEMLNKILQEAMRAKKQHETNKTNPHAVTKAQVGLGNVDNTSDTAKPISTATQNALNGKAASSHSHGTGNITSGTLPLARGGTGQTTLAGLKSALSLPETTTISGSGWSGVTLPGGLKICEYRTTAALSFPWTLSTGEKSGVYTLPAPPLSSWYGICCEMDNGTAALFTAASGRNIYYKWANSATSVSATIKALAFGA